MELLITVAAMAVAVGVDLLMNHLLFRNQEKVPLSVVYDETLMDDTDLAMAEQSRDVLFTHLGDRPVDALKSLTSDDRVEALGNMIQDLVALYGIRDQMKGVQFENLPAGMAGAYCYDEKVIHINMRYVLSNDEQAIRNLLLTVFHEMRHAVQMSVVDGNAAWNKDEARARDYAYNFAHYITAQVDFRGYQNQLIERDADTFALCVLKGEYSDEQNDSL